MVADLWAFDTQTFTWEAITPASPPSRAPRARYFHSSDAFAGRWLLVFGGMSAADSAERTANPDDLCVLADLHAFDTQTGHWTELGGGVGLGGTGQTSAAADGTSPPHCSALDSLTLLRTFQTLPSHRVPAMRICPASQATTYTLSVGKTTTTHG